MSHLKVFISMHPCSSKRAGEVLEVIDLDQIARVPVEGEYITVTGYIHPMRVSQVLIAPRHGVTLTVEQME